MSNQMEWLYNPHAKPAKELSEHDQRMIRLGWDACKALRLDRPDREKIELDLNAMFFMKHRERLKIPWLYANKVDGLAGDCFDVFEIYLPVLIPDIEEAKKRERIIKWVEDTDIITMLSPHMRKRWQTLKETEGVKDED